MLRGVHAAPFGEPVLSTAEGRSMTGTRSLELGYYPYRLSLDHEGVGTAGDIVGAATS
ncbi:MAG: hypothetical protein MI924_30090 [Chloroflexales bacterium]|nr:hypothetical protein [Chloroflexales bacterium]